MDLSVSYHMRKEKMKSLQVPTITETRQQLGDPLATMFFESCPESLSGELSIKSGLQGPGSQLWISPSDLLIEKVVLKPPLTNKHLKALTHEGILEIGIEIERRVIEDMEAKKAKALHDLECLLKFICDKEKRHLVRETLRKQQELFAIKLRELQADFEVLLENELAALEEKLRNTYEAILEERTAALLESQEEDCQEKIDEAIAHSVAALSEKFMEDLNRQEAILNERFNVSLEAQKEKYLLYIKNNQDVFAKVLQQLKHNLQCNNVANLMYIVCEERRKCLIEQQRMVNLYENRIKRAADLEEHCTNSINRLTKQRDDKVREARLREECLQGVIIQFQKFITFALRTAPSQAQFLLNVKKMMTFELKNASVAEKKRFIRQLMPWRKFSNVSVEPLKGIEIDDHHDCYNVLSPPVSANISNDDLLAMQYEDRLYVREDFRNKVSQGIRTNSMIWNRDAANLIDLFESLAAHEIENAPEEIVSDSLDKVNFDTDVPVTQLVGYNNIGLLAAADSIILQKSIRSKLSEAEDEKLERVVAPVASPVLLAAADSLTIVKNVDHVSSPEIERVFRKISKETIQITKSKVSNKYTASPRTSFQTLQLQNRIKRSDLSLSQIELKQEKMPKKIYQMRQSHLSMHRNSLELAHRGYEEEKTFKKAILPDIDYGKMVLNIPRAENVHEVIFSRVATVYKEVKQMDEPWKLYEPSEASVSANVPSRDEFLKKPNVAKVVGEEQSDHVMTTKKDFAVHRVHSIVDVLKKDPSLIRMFTRCSQ